MEPVKTTCPYCGVGCGVIATQKPDGTIDISGDPDHPANYGRLCSKGSALGETLSLDDRLLYPEVDGRRVSWDVALDQVAGVFSSAIRDYGPDSVAFYVSGQILSEDYYVANKLMKGFIGSANIDTNSRLCMASSVAGHRRAFGTDTVPGCYEDLEEADLIVLVGSNLAWCHPVIYQRIAAAKQARPEMKIVLIDPRRTMTADIADHHLSIKPDGDSALFCGLLTHLSKVGAINHNYIESYTNGFEDTLLAASKLSADDLQNLTGLSHDEREAFYTLFAENPKVVTVYSQGVNQSVCGTDKVNAIINCHLATGRIGKTGMGPFSITGQPNAMGGREVGGLANMLAAHMDIENPKHRALVQEFWASPTIAEKAGLKAVDLFEAVARGQIKALWIMATNPVDSMPDADGVEEAIKNCPFVVVSDVIAKTDTVRHAHVQLPALAWGEKDGTVTNSERRISRQRAFLPAPGEARADWWHLSEVARRMGFSEAFGYRESASIFRENAALSAYRNNDSRDFDIGAYAAINTKDYLTLDPFQWPQKEGDTPQAKRFFNEGDFYTPDRKGRLLPIEPPLVLPAVSDGAFILNTGRVRDHWHTMTRTAKTARLSSHLAEPFCEIHPEDAELLSLHDADLMTLSNSQGSIIVRVMITDRQKRGHLFVPIHWTDQFSAKARVDALVHPVVDPVSGQPALKNTVVKAAAYRPKAYGFLVSRQKPDFTDEPYWALARTRDGWRAEFALNTETMDIADFGGKLFDDLKDHFSQIYDDQQTGQRRAVWFDGDELISAIYLAKSPVDVSRNFVASCLSNRHENPKKRSQVLAGRSCAAMPDKGAIICSCFNVGANEIIQSGCFTVNDVGKTLKAGTNCGSCRAEISALLKNTTRIAAE